MGFLRDVLSFEKFNLGDMWGKIKQDPARLALGALDPFSTRVWNKTSIGKNWEPVVDQWGGAYGGSAAGGGDGGVYARARAAGVPTGPGSQMHDVARSIASIYAGGYGAGKVGSMANSGGGPLQWINSPSGPMGRMFGQNPYPLGGTGGWAGGATPPFNPNAGTPPFNPNVAMPSRPLIPNASGGPQWLQKLNGGMGKIMGGMSPSQPSPYLTGAENDAVAQQQRMATMAALMQAARPVPRGTGSPIADIGSAMMAGQQAGGQAAQDTVRAKLMQAQIAAANKQEAPSYASPIGKLLADRDLAEQQNNTAGVAAIDQAIAKEGGLGGDQLADVLRVRNDITRNSAEFLGAQLGYDKVMAAAKTDSPAGDMSLIFGFMKVLDPGSIVKEGEFATVQNSASVPDQIRGVYNRILRGERLTPEQRADFTYQAQQQFEPMAERQRRLIADAQAFAERNKLPFDDIVPEYVKPLLGTQSDKPPTRNPEQALPGLWNQIKDDLGRVFGGDKVPALPPGFTLDPEEE